MLLLQPKGWIRVKKNVPVPGGVHVRWQAGHAVWNITIDGLNRGAIRQNAVIKAK